MFALFYEDPDDHVMFPCVSSRMMYFSSEASATPALFASTKPIEKALRDYKRVIDEYVDTDLYRARLMPPIFGYEMKGIETLDNFRIVPVRVEPELDRMYCYQIPERVKL